MPQCLLGSLLGLMVCICLLTHSAAVALVCGLSSTQAGLFQCKPDPPWQHWRFSMWWWAPEYTFTLLDACLWPEILCVSICSLLPVSCSSMARDAGATLPSWMLNLCLVAWWYLVVAGGREVGVHIGGTFRNVSFCYCCLESAACHEWC